MSSGCGDLLSWAESTYLSDAEVARRAAASRAYYAAFHRLNDAFYSTFSEADIGDNGCAGHRAVARALRDFATTYPDQRKRMALGAEARRVHSWFVNAMKVRESADYALGDEFSKKTAADHVDRARRVMAFAAKL